MVFNHKFRQEIFNSSQHNEIMLKFLFSISKNYAKYIYTSENIIHVMKFLKRKESRVKII